MTFRVLVADRIAESGFAVLRGAADLQVVSTAQDRDRLPDEINQAHALIVRSDTKVTEELIARATHLIVIGRAGVGVDNVDVEAATRRGIAVLNAPGANTVSAAEHTIGLLLAVMRRIPWAARSMRDGQWDRKAFPGTELRGKTLALLGLGRIGAHVASIARAFGMKVLAHDPYLVEARAVEIGVELVQMEELFRRADVMSLHLPLTDETRHVINRESLAEMNHGAFLVNTARGALIDDEALLEAIEQGRLAGAALDVFEPEPLPADSPLRRCEQILLTPHLAASTSEAQERVAIEICTSIRDCLLTGTVGGAVNLPGVSGKVLNRLSGVLDMARRMGCLATTIASGRVNSVTVSYGGGDNDAPRPVMLAALEGVLGAMGVAPVSMVNVSVLAKDRGVVVERRVGQALAGYETTVGVSLSTGERDVTVVGAMAGERVGRVIRINDFEVDVPADGYVVVLRNRDVPGVIGRVGTLLGEAAINITSYHQSRGSEGANEALAAIVVDEAPESTVVDQLKAIPDVLEVTVANLNGSQRGV